MTDRQSKLPLWPFLAADALLLGTGGLLLSVGHRPLLLVGGVPDCCLRAAAAGSFIFPFARRNSDEQALAQATAAGGSHESTAKNRPSRRPNHRRDQPMARIPGTSSKTAAAARCRGIDVR